MVFSISVIDSYSNLNCSFVDFIAGVVSRHFESRRRIFVDSQPERKDKKEINDRNTKIHNRRRQVYCCNSMDLTKVLISKHTSLDKPEEEIFCYS